MFEENFWNAKKIKPKSLTGELPDKGGMPLPTWEQKMEFTKNSEAIVNPIVENELKTKSYLTLHGGRSLNTLLPTKRESKDWDLYAPLPKTQVEAQTIEKKIDTKAGFNVAKVKKTVIPKSTMLSRTKDTDSQMSKVLYEVDVPGKKSDVDIMDNPTTLQRVQAGGMYHETLQQAYDKLNIVKAQPMRMGKANKDIKRIEDFWKTKGIAPKKKVGWL